MQKVRCDGVDIVHRGNLLSGLLFRIGGCSRFKIGKDGCGDI